jgi:hypothetical protein
MNQQRIQSLLEVLTPIINKVGEDFCEEFEITVNERNGRVMLGIDAKGDDRIAKDAEEVTKVSAREDYRQGAKDALPKINSIAGEQGFEKSFKLVHSDHNGFAIEARY